LLNLLVIEKDIKARANVVCNALKSNLCGSHRAEGKLILKEGASLDYTHNHQWGSKDFVSPNYQFILEKNSRLIYNYRNLFPPKTLELKTAVFCKEGSSSNLSFVINGVNSKINLEEKVLLEGKDSQGILRLRLVGKENSQISARSTVLAKASGKGHLDCQGLLVDEKSKISLVPELICQNRQAQITHEASIGRVSEEELIYLRMRGLSESEAVDLIVSGFLKL
jgi:Fe-S cluster assembly scaffold protein SufB